MKIKPGFKLSHVVGENVIVAFGKANIDFSKIISLNDTAAFIWSSVIDKEFTPESVADMLCEEYEVDRETALADSTALLNEWLNVGIIE